MSLESAIVKLAEAVNRQTAVSERLLLAMGGEQTVGPILVNATDSHPSSEQTKKAFIAATADLPTKDQQDVIEKVVGVTKTVAVSEEPDGTLGPIVIEEPAEQPDEVLDAVASIIEEAQAEPTPEVVDAPAPQDAALTHEDVRATVRSVRERYEDKAAFTTALTALREKFGVKVITDLAIDTLPAFNAELLKL